MGRISYEWINILKSNAGAQCGCGETFTQHLTYDIIFDILYAALNFGNFNIPKQQQSSIITPYIKAVIDSSLFSFNVVLFVMLLIV